MKNAETKLCSIFKTKSHNTMECALNLKNKLNYNIVYQTNTIDKRDQNDRIDIRHRNDGRKNYHRGNNYSQQRGFNGRWRNNGSQGPQPR